MEDRLAAVASNLLENGLAAAPTRPLVAQLGTRVGAAFERSAANAHADVFGLEHVVEYGRIKRSRLFTLGEAVRCLPFCGAALLTTLVAAAVETCATST